MYSEALLICIRREDIEPPAYVATLASFFHIVERKRSGEAGRGQRVRRRTKHYSDTYVVAAVVVFYTYVSLLFAHVSCHASRIVRRTYVNLTVTRSL